MLKGLPKAKGGGMLEGGDKQRAINRIQVVRVRKFKGQGKEKERALK